MSRSDHLAPLERRALGKLIEWIDEPDLRDLLIQVQGGCGVLWIDRGRGLEACAEALFETPTQVREFATRLVAAGGRHVDDLHPHADVKLGDGIRVHALLAPLVAEGAAISIRLPGLTRPSLDTLVRRGLCTPQVHGVLEYVIEQRLNFLVTGGTASGKTTLLSAMLDRAAPTERIITIEDVAELRLDHPHHIALETRQANSEGVGGVTLDRLLRETLRMRPDRIVLGECRGAEVVTLLSALNTGHDGGAGTLHANSIDDIPARLESLGALAGLDSVALARQVASAIQCVIHVSRDYGEHRITTIATLGLSGAGVLRAVPLDLGALE